MLAGNLNLLFWVSVGLLLLGFAAIALGWRVTNTRGESKEIQWALPVKFGVWTIMLALVVLGLHSFKLHDNPVGGRAEQKRIEMERRISNSPTASILEEGTPTTAPTSTPAKTPGNTDTNSTGPSPSATSTK